MSSAAGLACLCSVVTRLQQSAGCGCEYSSAPAKLFFAWSLTLPSVTWQCLLQVEEPVQELAQPETQEPALQDIAPSEALPEDVILEDAAAAAVEPVVEDSSVLAGHQEPQIATHEVNGNGPAVLEAEPADGPAVMEAAAVHQDQDPASSAGAARHNHRCLLMSAAVCTCMYHIPVLLALSKGECAYLHCLLHRMRQQRQPVSWTYSGSVGRQAVCWLGAVCKAIGLYEARLDYVDQLRWDFSRILRGWRVNSYMVEEACNGPSIALTKQPELWCLCMGSVKRFDVNSMGSRWQRAIRCNVRHLQQG
jgi:hypothetical protein